MSVGSPVCTLTSFAATGYPKISTSGHVMKKEVLCVCVPRLQLLAILTSTSGQAAHYRKSCVYISTSFAATEYPKQALQDMLGGTGSPVYTSTLFAAAEHQKQANECVLKGMPRE